MNNIHLLTISLCVLALNTYSAEMPPYPSRPVRLVISYSAGGPVDIVGRIAGQKLSEALGQPVIADNRAGANGNIATEIVARSTPDGHTLLVGSNGSIAINPSLYKRMEVDPLRDLAPVTLLAASPLILVTHHVNIEAYMGRAIGSGDMVLAQVTPQGRVIDFVIYPSP